MIFWVVMPCTDVVGYWHFRGPWYCTTWVHSITSTKTKVWIFTIV